MKPEILVISNRMVRDSNEGADAVLLELSASLNIAGFDLSFACLSNHEMRRPIDRVLNAAFPFKALYLKNARTVGCRYFISTGSVDWLGYAWRFGQRHLPTAILRAVPSRILSRLRAANEHAFKKRSFHIEIDESDRRFVRNLCRNHNFAGVIVDFAWLAPLLSEVASRSLKVVYAHESLSLRADSFKRAGLSPDLVDWSVEEEAAMLESPDIVIVETGDEVTHLQPRLKQTLVLDMPRGLPSRQRKGSQVVGRVLFVGSRAVHNVQGLRWLLSDVWPNVISAVPNATLEVCGKVADEFLDKSAHSGVVWTGFSEDLERPYSDAQLVAVPLLAGTGFKTKLAEALAFGCACVATPAGGWGLDANQQDAVAVAQSPDTFSQKLIDLLNSNFDRQSMEQAAVASFVSASKWSRGVEKITAAINERQGSL